ncbi:MAG: RNase J family beta-CASP ribonuclease [Candidatus Woesearchaeota archaeon]
MIELRSVSGYEEVGRNMSALRVDNSVIILDMGLELEAYVNYIEDEDVNKISVNELIKSRAIPDISYISDWRNDVRAILSTHAHLDHIGAMPFLAENFNAPIIASPYTIEVLNRTATDNGLKIKNPLKKINTNSRIKIDDNLMLEFIGVTHSTPQTAMIAIHTPEGTIVYANDYKFDSYPIIGKKTNKERLKELGNQGVLALIVDSTRASEPRKTPSESVARVMLRDVMLATDNRRKIMIVTTFSSHIARLKSIVSFGERLGRKIVFLGRSLARYVNASDYLQISDFSKKATVIPYADRIKKFLRDINDSERGDYLLVVTGHQGEQNSVLSRMANGTFKFDFHREDSVIFSCTTIPTQTNLKNREVLEKALLKKRVRLFKDIHVSGHAAKEDHRDLINMLKPKHIIPTHGNFEMAKKLEELAVEMEYKNIHILGNQNSITLK